VGTLLTTDDVENAVDTGGKGVLDHSPNACLAVGYDTFTIGEPMQVL